MKRVKLVLWETWLPIILVALWLILSTNSVSIYFPPLAEILERTWDVWFFDGIVENLLPSLWRIIAGLFFAVVVGVGGGVILGMLPKFEESIRPILEFLRATPGVALLPIAIIFLGLGDNMKIFMIALASMWPILLNAIDGVRSVEPILLRVAETYRFNLKDRIRFIYLPNAAPQIFAGARISIAIAAVVMVVTEMIGSANGLGYYILDSQRTFNILNMWSGIIVLGILGYLLNFAFRGVEGAALSWHHKRNG